MLNNRIQRIDIELEQSRNKRLAAAIERFRWTLVANHQEMLFLHEQSGIGRDVEMPDYGVQTSHARKCTKAYLPFICNYQIFQQQTLNN
jgi:hypothetical protein